LRAASPFSFLRFGSLSGEATVAERQSGSAGNLNCEVQLSSIWLSHFRYDGGEAKEGRKMRTTILLCLLLLCGSPSLAASDEEVGKLGVKMTAAFKCSTYAAMSDLPKESDRLFQIGLKAARAFVEGIKAMNDPTMRETQKFLGETSTDFMVGSMWQDHTTKTRDEIRSGLSPGHWGTRMRAKAKLNVVIATAIAL
jgi:hypothetical protein